MKALHHLDRVQRRHRVLGVPIAVIYKFVDDQGMYLGALIAFYAFLSIFPLLLILSSVLGIVLGRSPELQQQIIDSAVSQLPLIGQQIQRRQFSGSGAAVTFGAVGAILGAMAVAIAVQNAMNAVWHVRRDARPNPVLVRVRSAGLLLLLAVFVLATTALSQLSPALAVINTPLGSGAQFGATAGAYLLSVAAFIAICRFGTATKLRIVEILPGALLGGLLWYLLQTGGANFVREYTERANVTEGVFGIVLALIIWLYLAALAFVLCLQVNVVIARHLYPRALFAAVTDNVDLTHADQRTYSRLAQSQSLKGFESVDVSFEHDGQVASAQSARLRARQAADHEAAERARAKRVPRGPKPH